MEGVAGEVEVHLWVKMCGVVGRVGGDEHMACVYSIQTCNSSLQLSNRQDLCIVKNKNTTQKYSNTTDPTESQK